MLPSEKLYCGPGFTLVNTLESGGYRGVNMIPAPKIDVVKSSSRKTEIVSSLKYKKERGCILPSAWNKGFFITPGSYKICFDSFPVNRCADPGGKHCVLSSGGGLEAHRDMKYLTASTGSLGN